MALCFAILDMVTGARKMQIRCIKTSSDLSKLSYPRALRTIPPIKNSPAIGIEPLRTLGQAADHENGL